MRGSRIRTRPSVTPVFSALLLLVGVLAPAAFARHVALGAAAVEGPSIADYESYLENPRMTGENQEYPHVPLTPYTDAAAALAGGDSPWSMSLNGTWRFDYAKNPRTSPKGFQLPGYDTSGWDTIKVPSSWQAQGYGHPIYRNVPSAIAPYDPPHVPDDLNPTGSYVRTFELPEDWDGRRQFLRFEGVTAGFFVWVNGRYVGYDQGGFTAAEFDVTGAVHPGGNTIAVRVMRWSAVSYLQNFDMWHLAGIFRDVRMYAMPQTRIHDVTVTTDLDERYADATLGVAVDLTRAAGGEKGRYTVRGTLYGASGKPVTGLSGAVDVTGRGARVELSERVNEPAKWSAEHPNLYTLALEVVGPAGEVTHAVRQRVGFREVVVEGRQILVNGTAVDFRGVNRHEHSPKFGRYVPERLMRRDLTLMKRNNVNAVRTSHYPNDPRWYDLADERGMWLTDEVAVETHYREDCGSKTNDCLADRPQWQRAMLERFVGMVERDKNHPSVFMWSTGNEAGLGEAHFAMADWVRKHDPTRLLYHQSNWPDGNAPYADVWGPRYPSLQELKKIANSATKPVLMGEWSHAMGNSLGGYEDYWEVIREEPALQGGFVWDWVDQGLRRPLVTTPDSSGNGIEAHLSGNPEVVAGHEGRAVYLSSLDDWVEVYRSPKLDITGEELTLDAWVRPGPWAGSFPIVTKGDHQYALKMAGRETLEFFVHDGGWRTVRARVPGDWYGNWHRVTGTYDGRALRLYIDGERVAVTPYSGTIDWSHYPVNIGRNSEKHKDGYAGRTARGTFDSVRVYDRALTGRELASGADPAGEAVLALNFDTFERRGGYLSYGSSPFLLNGVVSADRTPQPELAQMRYSHAWIRFEPVDPARGTFRVKNQYRFTGTSDIELRWKLTRGGRTLRRGTLHPRLAPGGSTEVDLRLPPAGPGDVERWLTVEAVLTEDTALGRAGHVVSSEQLAAGGERAPRPSAATGATSTGGVRVSAGDGVTHVTGKGFDYAFDHSTGTWTSMRAGERQLVQRGPVLDVWRAPIGNEWASWGQSEANLFWTAGLNRLRTEVTSVEVGRPGSGPDAAARVTVHSEVAAPGHPTAFEQTMTYRIDAAGTVRLTHRVTPVSEEIKSLPWLPRMGVRLRLPGSFERIEWYGRGPGESYPDRENAAHVGVWNGSVAGQGYTYLPPQATGNKTDTRWAVVSDGKGAGLLVRGDLDVAVNRHSRLWRALYPFQRTRDGFVTLHIGHAVTGLGGTPNAVRQPYRVRADEPHEYTITLRPVA